jgi:chromosome segregation ATPase
LSILTKIFVVLVTVLSVGLVAMIVPFVYKTEQYQEKYNTEVARRRTAEESSAVLQQTIQSMVHSNSEQTRVIRDENSKLKTEIGKINGERANLEAQITSERSALSAMQSQMARLAATLAQAIDLNKIQTTELNTLRDSTAKNRTDYFEAIEQIKTLQTQNDTLDRIVKRQAEEMASLEEANTKQSDILKLVPEMYKNPTIAGAPPIESTVKIEGQVTEIRKIDNNTFAEVNVGKKDGVTENMKFYIHRNGTFLGTLVITKVDQKNAAGRMVSLVQDIQKGDSVLSGQ